MKNEIDLFQNAINRFKKNKKDCLNENNVLSVLLKRSQWFFGLQNTYESDEYRYKTHEYEIDLIHFISVSGEFDSLIDRILLVDYDKTIKVLEIFTRRLSMCLKEIEPRNKYWNSYIIESFINRSKQLLDRLNFLYGIGKYYEEPTPEKKEVKRPKYLTVKDKYELLLSVVEGGVNLHKIIPIHKRNEIVSRLLECHPETAKDILNGKYNKGMNDVESSDLLLEYLQIIKALKKV